MQTAHKNVAQHLDAVYRDDDRQSMHEAYSQDEDLDALKAKGRGRADPKAKAKPKAKATFEGDCAYCKKYGHQARDFRTRIRDEASGVEAAKIPVRRQKGTGRSANALDEGDDLGEEEQVSL